MQVNNQAQLQKSQQLNLELDKGGIEDIDAGPNRVSFSPDNVCFDDNFVA